MEKELINEIKKMNKLLALFLTSQQDSIKSIKQLKIAGYTQPEIAELLVTSKKAVEMALYHDRKKEKGSKNG